MKNESKSLYFNVSAGGVNYFRHNVRDGMAKIPKVAFIEDLLNLCLNTLHCSRFCLALFLICVITKSYSVF